MFTSLRYYLVLLLCFGWGVEHIEAQNLVPNPSFEDTVSCPWNDGQIEFAENWFQPTPPTSDYLHSCNTPYDYVAVPQNYFGNQAARTGSGYAGMYIYHPASFYPDTSYREYIEVKLLDSMKAGNKYIVKFYCSLSDSSNFAASIGAYISSDSVKSEDWTNLSLTPQINSSSVISNKFSWIEVSGEYIAQGGEQFLVIGNFSDNIGIDTTNIGNGGDETDEDYNASYVYVDDVFVYLEGTIGIDNTQKAQLKVFPNPTSGLFKVYGGNTNNLTVEVYNSVGISVYSDSSIGNVQVVDLKKFRTGIYYIIVRTDVKIIKQSIILK